MKILLFLFSPLLLFASIEGVWKLDLVYTQEKNPNTRAYVAFSSLSLEFKNAKIYQNKNIIGRYKVDNQKIFESQDGKTWEASSIEVEKDYLTLDIGSALLYFKKFNPEIEFNYSLEMNRELFGREDFYKEDMRRYFDEEKILWKRSDLYATFKNTKEVRYRIYQDIANVVTQTDTHIFHFKDTSSDTFSYRRFGTRQNDWIHMDWYAYDRNKKYFKDRANEISFSPLFGDMELFHVLGKEDITTPAGTFTCTKVKGIEKPWNDPCVIWMIDAKPGIYAKVINLKEKRLYLLENIKEK